MLRVIMVLLEKKTKKKTPYLEPCKECSYSQKSTCKPHHAKTSLKYMYIPMADPD